MCFICNKSVYSAGRECARTVPSLNAKHEKFTHGRFSLKHFDCYFMYYITVCYELSKFSTLSRFFNEEVKNKYNFLNSCFCLCHCEFSSFSCHSRSCAFRIFLTNCTDISDQCKLFCFCFPSGLLCDLLWSDPDKDVQGWGENDRGVSFTFGADVVSKFLNRHDLDLICRAHQVRQARKC